jgi:hypothetical protein
MGIVFFCQSCGSRFEVDARTAGKKGRCKKCGQLMSVPKADQLASMTALPALAGAAAGAGAAVAVPRPAAVATSHPGARAASTARPRSMNAWLEASMSKIGLAPLSLPAIPKRPYLPSALDDAADSKPYVLEKLDRRDVRMRHGGGKPANAAVVAWRRSWGRLQKIFRWLNQSAYVASVPFIVILLFGIAVKSHSIAIFGATFVVLLNIGRIVAGIVDLAVIPLRDGLNPKKFNKPVRRVIEPVVTIALVLLAFTFIPWLSTGKASTASISDRLRSTAETLEKDIAGEVGKVTDKAKDLNLDKLGAQAQEKLKGVVDKAKTIDLNKLGAQAQEKLKGLGPSSGDPGAKPAADGAGAQPPEARSVGDLLKDVKRGREVLKDLQKEP